MANRIRFEIHYRLVHWTDKTQRWIAWRLPRWLVRWAVVRSYAKAWHDTGDKVPDELTYGEVYDAVANL